MPQRKSYGCDQQPRASAPLVRGCSAKIAILGHLYKMMLVLQNWPVPPRGAERRRGPAPGTVLAPAAGSTCARTAAPRARPPTQRAARRPRCSPSAAPAPRARRAPSPAAQSTFNALPHLHFRPSSGKQVPDQTPFMQQIHPQDDRCTGTVVRQTVVRQMVARHEWVIAESKQKLAPGPCGRQRGGRRR